MKSESNKMKNIQVSERELTEMYLLISRIWDSLFLPNYHEHAERLDDIIKIPYGSFDDVLNDIRCLGFHIQEMVLEMERE